ncbi:MAG: YggS family pyridoxal phosphate-dependent enzyme [Pirellulales bacterium]
MTTRDAIIARNLADIRRRMADAASRAGRRAEETRLVAVTKYVSESDIRSLLAAGVSEIGESRPQQLRQRAEQLAEAKANWHLIGHWQRNKVRAVLPFVSLLHAGDSLRLLEAVHEEAMARGSRLDVLLEVNISRDAAKHGFAPSELEPLLPRLAELNGIRVRGLMAMSGLESDSTKTRREFAAVRELRDQLRRISPAELSWDELSLGMSGDFEIGIEEGATWVRVGSALFEGLEP